MKLILINGPAGSGKDTFADMYIKKFGGYNFSSIDTIRDEVFNILPAKYREYDENRKQVKNIHYRNLLSKISRVLVEEFDYKLESCKDLINRFGEGDITVFYHIRELDQIKHIQKHIYCKSLLVTRDENEYKDVESFKPYFNPKDYNIHVKNDGCLKCLEEDVKAVHEVLNEWEDSYIK